MEAVYHGNFYKYRDGREHIVYEGCHPDDPQNELTICGKIVPFSSTVGTGRRQCQDCKQVWLLWELGE